MSDTDVDSLAAEANSYQIAGRFSQAESAYRKVLAASPSHPSALLHFGRLLDHTGRHAEALQLLLQSLRGNPSSAEHCASTAVVLTRIGRWDEATSLLRCVANLRPESAEAHVQLGQALAAVGRLEEAISSLTRAMKLDPPAIVPRVEIAAALCRMSPGRVAVRHAFRLEAQGVSASEVFRMAGEILQARSARPAAIEAFAAATILDPESAPAWRCFGRALDFSGRTADAIGAFERALGLRPDWPEAHADLGIALLRSGNLDDGWPEFDWRPRDVDAVTRSLVPGPAWDGSSPEGKTLLVVMEGGPAESIQFVRFAAPLAGRGARVVVLAQRPLLPLLRLVPGVSHAVAPGDRTPECDAHVYSMSLPRLCEGQGAGQRSGISGLWTTPYLHSEPVRRAMWAGKMEDGFKVGIAWQGADNGTGVGLSENSIPLHHFMALSTCKGVRMFSLQAGRGTEQLAEARAHMNVGIFDPPLDVSTGGLDDTAAVVANLDLVIAADTAVAHVAGGLGIAAWVAIPKHAHWRWQLGRPDSDWYPTVRLFRQRVQGDWGELFQRMSENLSQVVANVQ